MNIPRALAIFIKFLLAALWLFLVAWAGLYGLFIAFFVGVYLVPLAMATLAVVLAGLCLLLWLLCRKRPSGRRFRRAMGVFFALALLLALGTAAYDRFVVNRYEALREPSHWSWRGDYRPFQHGNRLVKATPDAAFRFAGDPPRMTGAYALYPVYAAAFQALAAAPPDKLYEFITLDGSDTIFKELNSGEADLIFGLRPSPEQIAAMREAQLRYTLTPLLREAFVFFVHKDNPATNLTQNQIRAVYSGRVTKWQELGVHLNAPLRPYQRNSNSGSQTTFERLMGDTPIMEPKKEQRTGDMGGVIERVADYRNSPGAIGFTFRFYAAELIGNPNIKLLAIDGVEPTVANIRNGTYPFITEAYAVTARPREGNTAKMIDFLRSPEGRRMIEAAGYTPAPEDAADIVLE